MERRKVQQTGSSTYTISLPKQWASDHGIEPGMNLALCPVEDGSLVIGANQTTGSSTPTIDVSDETPDEIRRTVERCYSLGYDRVRFVADELTADKRRAVTRALNGRMGLEVVDESDDQVTVGCLLNTTEVSIDRAVMQLQYVALSMQTDAVTALTTEDADLAAHIAERRDDAERRAAVVERYFERTLTDHEALNALGMTRPTLFDYQVVASSLGQVATEAATLARPARQLDESPPQAWLDATSSLARRARTHVEQAVSALFEADEREQAYDLEEEGAELRDDLDDLDRTLYESGRADAAVFGRVVDSLRHVTEHGDTIAARATAAALRQPAPDEE